MDKELVIREKEALIDELERVNKELLVATTNYKVVQNTAWLEVDFAEVLGKARPTVDEKKAYVSSVSINHRDQRDKLKLEKEIILQKIDLCGDKLAL